MSSNYVNAQHALEEKSKRSTDITYTVAGAWVFIRKSDVKHTMRIILYASWDLVSRSMFAGVVAFLGAC